MLATEILTQDHREVESLIERLENVTAGSEDANVTFLNLRDALEIHMRAEEEIFYPALAAHEDFGDELEDWMSEHEGVKENLTQMNELDPGSEAFQELLSEIKAAIELHAGYEEDDIFPEALEAFGRGRLQALGDEIEGLKRDTGRSRSASM